MPNAISTHETQPVQITRLHSRVSTPVEVWIESVTGKRWSEKVLLEETVGDLKRLIWLTTKLPPSQQTLVYAGRVLGDESVPLGGPSSILTGDVPRSPVVSTSSFTSSLKPQYGAGLRPGATLRLVLMARSGPNQRTELPDRLPSPSVTSDIELSTPSVARAAVASRLRANGRLSAPEDTSAKESSAGETAEEGEEDSGQFHKVLESASLRYELQRRRVSSCCQGNPAAPANCDRSLAANSRREGCCTTDSSAASSTPAADKKGTTRDFSPALASVHSHQNASPSEDLSEFSSGMIVCDLSNEFRKLKVKRRHHAYNTPATGALRSRGRSKPRNAVANSMAARDATSSDEERSLREDSSFLGGPTSPSRFCGALNCSAFPQFATRREKERAVKQTRQVSVRNSNHSMRCAVCAFKLTNIFNCRCGKTLCSRHRIAHACTKLRSGTSLKMLAQVSD